MSVKSKKKTGMVILFVFFFALAVDVVFWYISPYSTNFEQHGETEKLDPAAAVFTRCKWENGTLSPLGPDPHFESTISTDNAENVVIRLSEPIKQDTQFQVFYMREGESAAEGRSVIRTVKRGLSIVSFDLPSSPWKSFRFDIDGTVQIEEISVSSEKAVLVRHPYSFDIGRYLIKVLIIAVPVIIIYLLKRQKKILSAVDARILNPETRYSFINYAYILFASAMLLHHVRVFIFYKEELTGADFFHVYWLVFACISIILGRMWRDKGFWVLSAFLLFMYLRIQIADEQAVAGYNYVFYLGIYGFFGCYSIGRALGERSRRSFLIVFCALWTTGVTALSAMGIYAAWSQVRIANLGGQFIRVLWSRLFLFYHPVISGIFVSISLAVSMIGYFAVRNRIGKCLFIPAMLIMLIAGVLTSTRTNFILTAAEASLIVCLILYDHLKPEKKADRYHLKSWKWGLIFGCFLLMTVALTVIQPYIINGFNAVKVHGGLAISVARAEGNAEAVIQNRSVFTSGYNDLMTLNTRVDTWKSAIEVLSKEPGIMLMGESLTFSMDEINAIRIAKGIEPVAHCHNVPLQIIFEHGIPGLLLYLSFIIYFLIHAFRVMTNKDLPFYLRIVPVPALGCVIGELVDITSHVTSGCPQYTIMYVFIGLTVAIDQIVKEKNIKKKPISDMN